MGKEYANRAPPSKYVSDDVGSTPVCTDPVCCFVKIACLNGPESMRDGGEISGEGMSNISVACALPVRQVVGTAYLIAGHSRKNLQVLLAPYIASGKIEL